ncbi:MAG: Na-translocating system protein MpsC family protein [Solirubrobacterales bacterium]
MSLGDLHAILFEARPQHTEAALAGTILTCVLRGGLTPHEAYLIDFNRGDKVRAFREDLFRASGDDLTSLIETLTGRTVNAWVPVFEPRNAVTMLVFVLDSPVESLGDSGEALAAWATQVRRNSANLRAIHARHRERQQELAAELRRLRETGFGSRGDV